MFNKGVILINEEIREALRQMEMSDGWKIVKRYIDDRIADHTNQLLTCELDKVPLNRNSIETLRLIYVHIDSLKSTEVDQHP